MADVRFRLVAGIDAGGTTFKCAIADADGHVIARRRITVTLPRPTIAACTAFISSAVTDAGGRLEMLGIASFGPVDIDPRSPAYGTLLATPKPGWSNVPLLATFRDALRVACVLDTDVNGALTAERTCGAAVGVARAAYLTVGTGIGAGVWTGGAFLGAPQHPEFGHIRVARHPQDKGFSGVCPFHGDCLEGLASAPAIARRSGPPDRLPADHPAWEVEAFYLAQACMAIFLTVRAERILLGGGVMLAGGLIERVRDAFAAQLNGYLGQSHADIEALIQRPALGDEAGLTGAITLARRALMSR